MWQPGWRAGPGTKSLEVGRPAPHIAHCICEGEGSEEEVEGEEGEVLEGGEGADDDEYEESRPPPPKTMPTLTGFFCFPIKHSTHT